MPNCDRCDNESKITLDYGPHKFCQEHFEYFFEKRVRGTIRKYGLVKKGEKIIVAVSGGKDSLVMLHMLKSIVGRAAELHALMIDEGIPGYRDKALAVAKKECKNLDIEFTIVNQEKETGFSTGKIGREIQKGNLSGTSCSYCGTFRRDLLNKFALKLNGDKLATGHNLDDECQSIVMDIFKNDLTRMARLGPIAGFKRRKGFVPRIKPLYETPEKEIIAFAAFKEIEHYSEECCPFSYMAKRNMIRELINKVDAAHPSTKFSILKSFLQLKPLMLDIAPEGEIGNCKECGALSSKTVCHSCGQIEKIEKELESRSLVKEVKLASDKSMTCATTKGYK